MLHFQKTMQNRTGQLPANCAEINKERKDYLQGVIRSSQYKYFNKIQLNRFTMEKNNIYEMNKKS